ncbi:MAG: SDR family NAD(P)-dependent oxidoreductase, partial [Pseudomonadota bacterium]
MTKTILVLGGASDIGQAIARRFAAEGFGVQLAARSPERLEPVRSDIAIRHNVEVTTHAYDALDVAGAE